MASTIKDEPSPPTEGGGGQATATTPHTELAGVYQGSPPPPSTAPGPSPSTAEDYMLASFAALEFHVIQALNGSANPRAEDRLDVLDNNLFQHLLQFNPATRAIPVSEDDDQLHGSGEQEGSQRLERARKFREERVRMIANFRKAMDDLELVVRDEVELRVALDGGLGANQEDSSENQP